MSELKDKSQEGPPPPNTLDSGGQVDNSGSLTKDMATDIPESGSNVVTYLPFSPGVDLSARGAQTPKSSRRRPKNTKVDIHNNRSIQIAPGIFEANDFKKYLTVTLDDTEADIFDVHRDLINCCGKEPTVYTQGSGRILVEAASPEVSDKLQKLTSLGGITATCTPHRSMNSTKGIIYAPQLLKYTEEKLLREFEEQGVSEVRRMMKTVNGATTPQPQLVLTFDRLRLPEVIHAAWYRYKVRAFIPRPMRCFHCQEFGHALDSCRRKSQGFSPVCVTCGEESHGECRNPPSCVHCGGDHPSSSNQCDMYLFEKEVQMIKVSDRLPYREARLKAQNSIARPGLTFARVVADSKSSRKRKNTGKSNNVTIQSAPRMKRTISKESVSEPPAKMPSKSLSSSPVMNDAPAVAGSLPSPKSVPATTGNPPSSETAPATAGAFVPSGTASLVVVTDVHATDDASASMEAVVTLSDHNSLHAISDSPEAQPVAPAKPATERPAIPSRPPQNAPSRPKPSNTTLVIKQPKSSVAASPKVKPQPTKKVDRGNKKLSRDSPIEGRKPR